MSKSGGSVSEDPPTNMCGSCNAVVGGGEKAMQCDMCIRWVHNSCCNMPEDLYKVLAKHEKKCTGTKWFCKSCESHFSKMRMEVKILTDRQTIFEIKQDTADKDLSEIKREFSEFKKEFSDFVKDRKLTAENTSVKVDGKIDEIKIEIDEIKNQVSGQSSSENLITLANAPVRTIQVEVSEVMEREKRKNNVVIFGIEETNDEFATRDKVNTIVRAIGIDENKVKYLGRVGRYIAGSRARIVRVVCDDAETKRNFLKAANKLKTLEGYESTYVGMDLTKVQQLQDKALRDKLKEIRIDHKEAKINNGEVVIFEEGNRKILFSQQK